VNRIYRVAGVDVSEHIRAVVDQAGEPSDEVKERLRAILRPAALAVRESNRAGNTAKAA